MTAGVTAGCRRYRSTASSTQFNRDLSRDLQLYWGVRSRADQVGVPAIRGRGTEIYLKAACTFRQ